MKLALTSLLSIFCCSAAAEWVPLSGTETDALYADPSTILREGSIAKMLHLIDYKTVRTPAGATPYKSTRLQQENDCSGAKARLLYISLYSRSMAGGEIVLSDAALEKWEPVTPGSGRETVWKFACGKS